MGQGVELPRAKIASMIGDHSTSSAASQHPAIVSIVKVGNSVQQATREAMELAGWRDFMERGSDVSLKPNLTFDFFLPGAVTSPWVVEGVIQTIRDYVGKIYIVESNQVLVDVEKAVRQTCILDLCQRYDVEWINMSYGRYHRRSIDKGLVLQEIDVPEILLHTQLLTIPVMKTHGRTVITGAIKNQWGCLTELRHKHHLVVNEALADVNSLLKPNFAVMDGTIGLEGNGPKSGIPRIADRVLASGDIVALDTVAAKIMGFDPQTIPHIQLCAKIGLGRSDPNSISVRGEEISNLNFKRAKNNVVALVEILLRRSFLQGLVFNTPFFRLCVFGALTWYYIWYYLVAGKRYRDQILRDPKYGKQWTL